MITQETTKGVCWNLLQASVCARKQLQAIADQQKLTTTQLHALCLLHPDKPIAMHALSETLSCDASNVTGLVDRLTQQGFVERREAPEDRRVKMIALTAAGTQLRSTALSSMLVSQPDGLANLTSGERAMLDELLAKMLRK